MTQWLTVRHNRTWLRALAFIGEHPVGGRHLLQSVVLAVLFSAGVGIQPALADPLPITIDGTGPGALTSRWLFGQSEGFFVTGANQTPGPQLRSGSTIVARDDCAHISGAVGFVDGAGNIATKFSDSDNNVVLSGKTVTAGPEVMDGLVTSYQFAVIDGPGVVRGFFTMQNPTASPKTVTVQRGVNLSFQETVHTSSSGDATFGLDDRWLVVTSTGPGCNGSPLTVDAIVWFGPGTPESVPVFTSKGADIYVARFQVTIPAGDARHLMWFLGMHQDVASALNGVNIFDNVGSDSPLVAGLTSEQLVKTVNWDFGPSYACSGFDPPFDTVISLKPRMNRAIPLKIQLVAGTTPVTDLDIAGANPVVNISFSAGGGPAVDVTNELLPVGQSSEGNSFAFDPASGLWTFNLGTKAFTAPGTYTVTAASGATSYVIDPTCSAQFVRLP